MTKVAQATPADLPALAALGAAIGPGFGAGLDGPRDAAYFQRCLGEGRAIFVAYDAGGEAVGYAQLNPAPHYPPFRAQKIPEIQDLNVLPASRGQGIGGALVARCEDAARKTGAAEIGLGVGLDQSYGAAQRLYVKRGYVPDGRGALWDEEPVRKGALKPLDDNLTLKMTKVLG
jgi:GNAT superfamily N-acetyltransferase